MARDENVQFQKSLKIEALKGRIVPVPTVQEINPSVDFGDAYAVEIVTRRAAEVSKLFATTFPKDPSIQSNHLRRFVKESFLPEPVKRAVERERNNLARDSDAAAAITAAAPDVPTIFVLIQPPLPELAQLRTALAPFVPPPYCSSSPTIVDSSTSDGTYNTHDIGDTTPSFPIYNLSIPLQPPLTQQQADYWSSTSWPTNFNAAFPRGFVAPPAKVLEATRGNIAPKAGYYLSLARKVAQEAKRLKRGRGIGVVLVDPALASMSGTGVDDVYESCYDDGIVAVAGDARYCAPGIVPIVEEENNNKNNNNNHNHNPDCEGGPEFHAIMRAVEMVAHRRRAASSSTRSATTTATATTVHNTSLTQLETYYLFRPHSSAQYTSSPSSPPPANEEAASTSTTSRIAPRSAGGYLCTDLDIYITHEPCLTCSMGMLLSRFRAVTFPRRGRLRTGGLASSSLSTKREGVEESEGGQSESISGENNIQEDGRMVYYGLHWRKELNWRAMCFEFIDEEEDAVDGVEDSGDYHA